MYITIEEAQEALQNANITAKTATEFIESFNPGRGYVPGVCVDLRPGRSGALFRNGCPPVQI